MLLAPEIGTSELLIIAAIALIVVGPKDLPVLLKRFGQLVGRMRNMAADFRSSFEDMARQSELDDLRKEVEAMRSAASNAVSEHNQQITESLNAGFEHDQSFDAYADIFPPPPLEETQAAPEPAVAETAPAPKKRAAPRKKAAAAPAETTAVEPAAAPKKPRKKPTPKDIVT